MQSRNVLICFCFPKTSLFVTFFSVKQVDKKTLLLEAVADDSTEAFDFCMCNPPFFGSAQELNFSFKSRKESRPRPRNAFCATVSEVVASGGEIDFVSKLIKESEQLKDRVRIYSTMIGHKSSLNPLKKLLREVNVISFKQTEFCQGHTTRWGLAWTFCDIDLRKVPEITLAASRKLRPKQPFRYVLPTTDGNECDVKEVSQKMEKIMTELLMSFEKIKVGKNVIAYNFVATKNTWSHQRRNRRAKHTMNQLLSCSGFTDKEESCNENLKIDASAVENCSEQNKSDGAIGHCPCFRATTPDVENALNKLAEVRMSSPGSGKREYEEDDNESYYQNKKIKTAVGECKCHLNEFYLKALLVIRNENSEVTVELSWVEGIENREVLHQIMQYIKNNLKLCE